MEVTESENIFNCILFYLAICGIFNFLALPLVRKAAEKADIENTELKPEAKDEIEMVIDSICGCTLPKSEAYVLVKDDIRHYFCSWDCKEKFIAGNQM